MYCILAFARIVATTVEFHLSVGNLNRGFLMHVLSDAQASDCQKNYAFRMLIKTSLMKGKYSRFFDRSGPHHLSTVASAARLASFGLWP
jgi:hypothetical protein